MYFLTLLNFILLLSTGISASDFTVPCNPSEPITHDAKTRHSYLAIFPDNNEGIDCLEHIVVGDNDCGFHVLGITRDQLVCQLLPLKENEEARRFLAPEIRHAFLSGDISSELKPSVWHSICQAYQKAWADLDHIMKTIKAPIVTPYPETLGLEERVAWLGEQTDKAEEKADLRGAFRAYQDANAAIDRFCQDPSTFEHYIRLYRIPKTVWLGYQSALLWARTQQVNFHIWRRSTKQTDVLTLIDAYTSPRAHNTIHMLHTSGFTHFNLLEEVKKRNLAAEREQVKSWNQTAADFPADKTLFELFAAQAEKTPDALAITSSSSRLTYRETYLKANQLAHALLEKGILPNRLVGVLMKKGWEQVVGCLGILGSGAAFLPIDPTWPASRIQKVLELGDVEFILTQQAVLEAMTESAILTPYTCFAVDNGAVWTPYSTTPLSRRQTPTDIAYVIFTSGSTGQPKGVVINHQGAVNTLFDINQRFHVTATDKVLALSNLTFDLAIYDIFGTLAAGGAIVLPDAEQIKEPSHWVREITRQPVSIWNTVPMFMQMLVEYLDHLPISESLTLAETLRLVLLSGDWIPPNLPNHIRRHFPRSQIISLGGATEGSIWSILYPVSAVDPSWKSIPYGRAMANQTMYVLDDTLSHCPMGVLGDIYIGGGGVALGYWRDEEKSAASFITHPITRERLYKTGDLGRWNASGYMEFMGRKDTQVKIDGYRIELGDIEAALSEHPSVKQCVLSTYEQGPHKRLVAYVVPNKSFVSSLDKKEELTADWRSVYEGVYQSQSTSASEDLTFNIVGWNSSYTGKPLAAEEMREWVNYTVNRILSCKPKRLLEIGCGTGLLLSRIAPHCESYVATDISDTAIGLIERIKMSHPELTHVVTYQRSADNFTGLDLLTFDTIVMNSVAQCFPSVDYLLQVIEGAVGLLTHGGSFFIGDIRNLALLESYHASVQLYQAPDTLKREEFTQRVQSHLAQEEELLIDPTFFYALRRKIPQIQHVQIQLKQGQYPNELNRFRYDVSLQIGHESVPMVIPSYYALPPKENPMTALHKQILDWKSRCSDETPQALGFKGLLNARLQRETLTLAWLKGELDFPSAGDLKTYKTSDHIIDPDALYQLGRELGLRVEVRWNYDHPTQLFDAVFIHAPSGAKVLTACDEDCCETHDWERYINYPMLTKTRRTLTPLLAAHCQTKLPPYMVPTSFILLERLPLSSNGKVDGKALPLPTQQRHSPADYREPTTIIEKTLTALWCEALGIERIGLDDNFFALGGDSLLAVRLIGKCNQHFKTNYPVSTLFTHNTLKTLATVFQKTTNAAAYHPLLAFHEEGRRSPVFFIHSGRGGAEVYVTLANHFNEDQPIYVLESYNLCNEPPFLSSIEEMAVKYLTYVQGVQPRGPYYLGGWSLGGVIAYEMAQILHQQSQEVRTLYFLDTFLFTNFECKQFHSGIDKFIQSDPFYTRLPMPYREHVKAVDRVQTVAMLNYKPAPYFGDVVLLKASEPWSFLTVAPEVQWNWITRQFMHHAFTKKHNGWSKHIPKLKIYPVPGHHQSIMEGDNARAMAGIIQEDLLARQLAVAPIFSEAVVTSKALVEARKKETCGCCSVQ